MCSLSRNSLDLLGTIWEELKVDLGVAAGTAVEHRAGQIGIEMLQDRHQASRRTQQKQVSCRLLLILKQSLVGPQLELDFAVVGHWRALRQAQAARRLALGQRRLGDAVLGHVARGQRSDTAALPGVALTVLAAAHGGIRKCSDEGKALVEAGSNVEGVQSRLLRLILTWIRDMHIHILGIAAPSWQGLPSWHALQGTASRAATAASIRR
jgi:hypothetical protein